MTPWYARGPMGEYILDLLEGFDRQKALEEMSNLGMSDEEIRECLREYNS